MLYYSWKENFTDHLKELGKDQQKLDESVMKLNEENSIENKYLVF